MRQLAAVLGLAIALAMRSVSLGKVIADQFYRDFLDYRRHAGDKVAIAKFFKQIFGVFTKSHFWLV